MIDIYVKYLEKRFDVPALWSIGAIVLLCVVWTVSALIFLHVYRRKYRKVSISSGMTGREIVEKILADHGISDILIISVADKKAPWGYSKDDKTLNIKEQTLRDNSLWTVTYVAFLCARKIIPGDRALSQSKEKWERQVVWRILLPLELFFALIYLFFLWSPGTEMLLFGTIVEVAKIEAWASIALFAVMLVIWSGSAWFAHLERRNAITLALEWLLGNKVVSHKELRQVRRLWLWNFSV